MCFEMTKLETQEAKNVHDGSNLLGGVAGPQEVGWGTWNEGAFFFLIGV